MAETNRNSIRLLLLASLAIAMCVVRASAQSEVWLGTMIGYQYGAPLSIDREPGVVNRFDFDGRGTSYNHTASIGGRVIWPTLLGATWGFESTLSLNLSNGQFTSRDFPVDTALPQRGNQRFVVRSDMGTVGLAFAVRKTLNTTVSVSGGLYGDVRLFSVLTQTLQDASGTNSDVVIANGDAISSTPFRYGPALTFGLTFPLSQGLSLQFEPGIRADAGALFNGLGTRALSYTASLSLLARVPGTREDRPLVVRPDTLRPPKRALSASVSFVVDDKPEATKALVQARSTLHQELVPFVPTIYFDAGTADLERRYLVLNDSSAATFTNASLIEMQPYELYSNTLNVLGMRMRADSITAITVTGTYSTSDQVNLGDVRAALVRDYLTKVWHIDARRITVRSKAARVSTVQIMPMTKSFLTIPITSRWYERTYMLPTIRADKKIVAEAGIASSVLTLSHGAKRIGRYYGDDESAPQRFDLTFSLKQDSAGLPPLVAELVVQDSVGTIVTTRSELPFVIQPEPQSGSTRSSFTILAAQAGETDIEEANHKLILAAIDEMKTGATVTVTAPADAAETAWKIQRQIIDETRKRGILLRELKFVWDENASLPDSNVRTNPSLFSASVRVDVRR